MSATVFFSWQSDTSAKDGRSLVDRALQKAIRAVGGDVEIEEAVREGLELDRDTKGVAGQPPIVDTIFKKIDQAAVFVPDLTFVGTRKDGRPTPNPNVLIEYGWALHSLGYGRIVCVMNAAHGKPTAETMPFDMAHLRRPITYTLHDGADDDARRKVRDELAAELATALRAVLVSEDFLQSLPKPEPAPLFVGTEPKNGPARFRIAGSKIGIEDREYGGDPKDIFLSEGPAIWFRLMPKHPQIRKWSSIDIRKANQAGEMLLTSFYFGNFGYVRAADGCGTYVDLGDKDCSSVTFCFSSGEIWTIDTWRLQRSKSNDYAINRPGLTIFEPEMCIALNRYRRFLLRLGIVGPYRWIAGIEGLSGMGLFFDAPPGSRWFDPRESHGMAVSDSLVLSGEITEDGRAGDALKPFFELIFSDCNLERGTHLDAALAQF